MSMGRFIEGLRNRVRNQAFFRFLGYGFFGVGAIGTVLPLLPTTGFWILAVWCLAKSDDPLAQALLDHPKFGPSLRDWFDHGAICRTGKLFAVGGMIASFVAIVLFASLSASLLTVIGVSLAIVSAWLVTRPNPEDVVARLPAHTAQNVGGQ